MKKSSLFVLVIFGILMSACAHRSVSENWNGYCGQIKVFPGERYKTVLEKCGEPDEYYYYENDLGLRIGTRIRYGLLEEESPTYFYFDRWGKCIKIEQVPPPTGLDILPVRIGGQQRGLCRNNEIVSIGSRLQNVLSRCGQPDDYTDSMDLISGEKRSIELKYNQVAGQSPTYFYFDQWGICTRIRMGSERN